MQILTLLNGPIEENAYALAMPGQAEAILIDPGSSAERLKTELQKQGLHCVAVLATHGHFDHVGAVHAFQALGATFAMHPDDLDRLEELEDTFAYYGMGTTHKPKVDRLLKDGEVLELAGLKLKVLWTPGHTAGSSCFYHAESASLFTGDTLFARSIGKSDSPSEHEQLLRSIREKLLGLPPETKVYPGHGPASSLADEKTKNPFLILAS